LYQLKNEIKEESDESNSLKLEKPREEKKITVKKSNSEFLIDKKSPKILKDLSKNSTFDYSP
jgi:hypothetical protein